MTMPADLRTRCTALLPPDTHVRYAWTAQRGLNPSWRILSWLVIASPCRVVAVTDDTIYVFRSGSAIVSPRKPKSLKFSVPRAAVPPPARLTGSWTRTTIGPERMWVRRRAYPVVRQALGAAS
jgi:hypothetical protein